MARLTGTGRVADDLYLLARDDATGRPFLQPRALGLGLAGALLAELVFAGAIWMEPGRVAVTGQAAPPGDPGCGVLSVLLAEREQHPVRDWLQFLAPRAEGNVAGRLARAGYLNEVSSRRPWRGAKWVPADADSAFAPLIRVRVVLDPARPATVADVTLTGLAVACGLGSRVLPYGPPDGRNRLEAAVRRLTPGLRALIAQTQAAVDSAVLSHRV